MVKNRKFTATTRVQQVEPGERAVVTGTQFAAVLTAIAKVVLVTVESDAEARAILAELKTAGMTIEFESNQETMMTRRWPAIPKAIQRVLDAVRWSEVYLYPAGFGSAADGMFLTADQRQAVAEYNALSKAHTEILRAAVWTHDPSSSALVQVVREYMLWRAFTD